MNTVWRIAPICAVWVFIVRANALAEEQPLKPDLKFPTLAAFETEIGEPGLLLESEHVLLFAPKRCDEAARIVHPYLVRAYDELYALFGIHTKYKIVVYHFPKGNPNAFGGTSECAIYYDDSNLDLAASAEWTRHRVPHLAGYIEEMAHNFDDATHEEFGWETIGWTVGTRVCQKVAGNPILERQLAQTRRAQSETFARYKLLGCVFPPDVAPNLVDRVHAYILARCERKYGPNFWPDFFAEVRKERERLADAVRLGDGDRIRNERYRITIECFDRLPGLEFKKMLEENGISLRVDVKSLHPTEPGWDRRLIESAPETPPETSAETPPEAATTTTEPETGGGESSGDAEALPDFDPESLSPLHKAAYEGREAAALGIIEKGGDIGAEGPNGWTALHMAAIGGHEHLCGALIENGADPRAKDSQGRTPADLARIQGHDGTAAFLLQKVAAAREGE